jgi:hypothetical protein
MANPKETDYDEATNKMKRIRNKEIKKRAIFMRNQNIFQTY